MFSSFALGYIQDTYLLTKDSSLLDLKFSAGVPLDMSICLTQKLHPVRGCGFMAFLEFPHGTRLFWSCLYIANARSLNKLLSAPHTNCGAPQSSMHIYLTLPFSRWEKQNNVCVWWYMPAHIPASRSPTTQWLIDMKGVSSQSSQGSCRNCQGHPYKSI